MALAAEGPSRPLQTAARTMSIGAKVRPRSLNCSCMRDSSESGNGLGSHIGALGAPL